jgi:hypothetical protein
VKTFIQKMVQSFENSKEKIYLLKILNQIVDHYLPTNQNNKHNILRAKERLSKLQIIMKDCGLLTLLLKFISKDDVKLADQAIKLLTNLICESNLEVY